MTIFKYSRLSDSLFTTWLLIWKWFYLLLIVASHCDHHLEIKQHQDKWDLVELHVDFDRRRKSGGVSDLWIVSVAWRELIVYCYCIVYCRIWLMAIGAEAKVYWKVWNSSQRISSSGAALEHNWTLDDVTTENSCKRFLDMRSHVTI